MLLHRLEFGSLQQFGVAQCFPLDEAAEPIGAPVDRLDPEGGQPSGGQFAGPIRHRGVEPRHCLSRHVLRSPEPVPRAELQPWQTTFRRRWNFRSELAALCGRRCERLDLSIAGYCQLDAEEAKLPRAPPSHQYTSAHEGNTDRIAPSEEGAIAGGPVLNGQETITAELEVVVDRSVGGEELPRMVG